jgi:hypothetical protein
MEEPPMPATEQSSTSRIQRERLHFRSLLLANPNYFGNVKQSPFKPVSEIAGNTAYEELACVGFSPAVNLLNAVVNIKLPYGFGGGLCTNGSQEYVRFYASYDGGKTWVDLGLTSFTTFDIPETPDKPFVKLEYAVALPFDPQRKLCFLENLVLVRGILSWNAPPPPNDPGFTPVWGNLHDTTIEVAPLPVIPLEQALADMGVQPPAQFAEAIDLTQVIKTAPPKTLGVPELQRLYTGRNIPPHRYALTALNRALNATPDVRLLANNFGGPTQLFGAEFDVAQATAAIASASGNTSYEQLECVGLNETSWSLEGIIRIKRPNGYSGGPCTAGSHEYVTFWADLNGSGAFATCLGTASVTVYDIPDIPKDGLEYAVSLPTSLFVYRQPCTAGAKLIPIRATLSWQIPPPCIDPNYVPVWGNREETLICLPPGTPLQQGQQSAFFDTVGSMSVTKINAFSGLADGTSTVGFTAVQSPFGGEVTITGYVYPASNLSAGAAAFKYRISVSGDGGATWTALNDTFTVSRQLIPWGGIPAALPDVTQNVDLVGITAGYYTYQADWTTGPGDALIVVSGNVLTKWQTAGKPNGLWQIKMDVYDPSTNMFFPAVNTATILLDNVAPLPNIIITSGGGSCGDFYVGDEISGTYSVSDLHFYFLSLELLPGGGGSFTAPVPLPRFWTDPGASTLGDAGTWTLNTAGLPPCGYVVVLNAYDRTIVNSGFIGNYSDATQGFCLKVKA